MKKVTLVITAQLATQLGITDGADDVAVANAINTLSIKASKADTLQKQLDTATERNTELAGEITDLKNADNKKHVTALLTAALAEKKITAALSAQFEKDYASNPDGLKTVLEGMGAYTSVVDKIREVAKKDASAYEGKSWDELWDAGKIDAIKSDCPEAYKVLYKKEFGSEPVM